MSVISHKGLKCGGLIPSKHEFSIRVLKESTNIGANVGDTGNGETQQHGNGGFEVFPVCHVVSSPDSCVALGSNEVGTSQDKGTELGVGAGELALESGDSLDK